MRKFKIIRDAERQARSIFLGIAIPHQPTTAEGVYSPIRSEKVLKFNRKSLVKMGKVVKEKSDPRYRGGDDNMIVKVGKPGSRERVEGLRAQYDAILADGCEVSPFGE